MRLSLKLMRDAPLRFSLYGPACAFVKPAYAHEHRLNRAWSLQHRNALLA